MEIRKLRYDDLSQLALLYEYFWSENSNIQKMERTFNELENDDSYIFLCAIENNKVCGSIMGIICYELYGNCDPFLVVEDMIVDASYRRKGVGKKLFLELEKRAKDKKCRQILLVTESNREDACNFYESIGFDPIKNKGYKKKII
jgi:ribosomal protein S18 acetylase RimI-like enzyme